MHDSTHSRRILSSDTAALWILGFAFTVVISWPARATVSIATSCSPTPMPATSSGDTSFTRPLPPSWPASSSCSSEPRLSASASSPPSRAGSSSVLTGLMARAMGGGRQAMLVSAFAASIGGAVFFTGSFMSYMSFDLLWWVGAAWCVVRLVESGDARWWLGIGTFIGLGFMTKYTMAFFAVALLGAMLLTPNRRYFRNAWFWWRRGADAAHCLAQSLVAVPTTFRQPCLDAQHPRPRHWPGPH